MDTQKEKFEKIRSYIRIIAGISLFLIMCSGIFINDSSIYANEVLGIKSSPNIEVFKKEKASSIGFAPKNVTVKGVDWERNVLVYSDYAKDILSESNIVLDSDDEILPSSNEYIPHNGVIVIVKVESKIFNNFESIPFKKIEKEDPELEKGVEKISIVGSKGLMEKTIRVIYKDGVPYRSEIIDAVVITNPVNEIKLIGTKPMTVASCSYWNKYVDKVAPESKDKKKNTWMKYVMYCESGCDSGKGFDKYFDGSKAFYGLYQFTEYTFKAYGGTNIFDGYDQIDVVSRMYDLEGNAAHHWPACNNAFERDYNK